VLSQNQEPPPGLTEKHITDRLVPAPVLTLHSNELLPRHYLAVENHRLYPFTIDAKPLFDHYVRHIPTPLSDYTLWASWLSSRIATTARCCSPCRCRFAADRSRLWKRKALRARARRAFALNDQRACFSAAIRSSSGGCDMNNRLKPPAGAPEMPKAAI